MSNEYITSISNIIDAVDEKTTTHLETLKIVGPGLWLAGYKYLIVKSGKIIQMTRERKIQEDDDAGEGELRVELSSSILEELGNYKKPTPKKTPSTYMFVNTPFPVFAPLTLEGEVDPHLSGLMKVIDKRDPVSLEELTFVDAEFWKGLYEKLKNVCVDVCPNGHALSFDTLCNFMSDDGWSMEEICELCKVKCPCCRKRFQIHDTLPMLCGFFIPVVQSEKEKTEKERSKPDNIQTYFSTLDDEEDEELEEVRRMVASEEDEEENDDEDYENDDDDEEDSEEEDEEEI